MANTENSNMKIKAIEKKNLIRYAPEESVKDCNCIHIYLPFSKEDFSSIPPSTYPTTHGSSSPPQHFPWLYATTCSQLCISQPYCRSCLPIQPVGMLSWRYWGSQTPSAWPIALSSRMSRFSQFYGGPAWISIYISWGRMDHEGQHDPIVWISKGISVVPDEFHKSRRKGGGFVVPSQHNFE